MGEPTCWTQAPEFVLQGAHRAAHFIDLFSELGPGWAILLDLPNDLPSGALAFLSELVVMAVTACFPD